MDINIKPGRNLWDSLCQRPSSSNPEVKSRVEKIIDDVRTNGDAAIRRLSREIDGFELESTEISKSAIEDAGQRVSPELKSAIRTAISNVRAFHSAEMPSIVKLETTPGVICYQKPVPIDKVGIYIPGGTAPLFSTVVMLAVPARIAGCKEVIMCTPASREGKVNDAVLYTAAQCGVDRIFTVGGAQAIAAMAYGTETIPRVDKIFGPGNQYVTTAKQILGGNVVSIDMPAGPSEVMVIADSTSNPCFVAADLLSQAEHGRDSQVMLVCDNENTAKSVAVEIEKQAAILSRRDLVETALSNSRTVIFEDIDSIVDFANTYAPEHLIISTEDPWKIADGITSAGSIFVGAWSPESAGDYASGTNHTLPTCAWARSCSGVNIDSFIKKITIQELTREGIKSLSDTIITMAENESLQAHANAVKVRINEK